MKTPSNFVAAYGSQGMAALRLVGLLGLVIALAPIQFVCRLTGLGDPFRIPKLFHRVAMRLLAFQIRVHGAPASSPPVLFVANHASYLDIPVLSTLIDASFVAKAEVERWPLIGFLATLQNTIFIERRATEVGRQSQILRDQLAKRRNLIFFPEGTSTDGIGVLPFKSSLFSVVEEGFGDIGLTVQPVSIVCTKFDGVPIRRAERPFYAWYGDMTLAGHLWNILKLGRFTVDVIFHAAVQPQSFANRKVLSQYCHQQVAHGIEQCLRGRDFEFAPIKKQLPKPA